MHFTKEDLELIQKEYQTVRPKYHALLSHYTKREFTVDGACEFARQGFLRRLKILAHCIEEVFKSVPPDITQPPEAYERLNAVVYLQAFIFNVFGCIDNLAHVWVKERGLTEKDGKPLPKNWIGFSKKHKTVRKSLSKEFQDYLAGLNMWFENLESFRHALAHRIPPYIPPYSVLEDKLCEYEEIEARINEARMRGDCTKVDRLKDEKKALVRFEPVITHSFSENARKVYFHAQMIADFNTVEGIAQKLLEEFD